MSQHEWWNQFYWLSYRLLIRFWQVKSSHLPLSRLAGLSTVEEVATGVEHILADMIAKDPETLTCVKTLWECITTFSLFQRFCRLTGTFVITILSLVLDRCEKSLVTIQSHVSKAALKEKEPQKALQNKNKDIDKFHLYFDFTCNVLRIQPHQVANSSFSAEWQETLKWIFTTVWSTNQRPARLTWFISCFQKIGKKIGWWYFYLKFKTMLNKKYFILVFFVKFYPFISLFFILYWCSFIW